jgi:hypothetical protein
LSVSVAGGPKLVGMVHIHADDASRAFPVPPRYSVDYRYRLHDPEDLIGVIPSKQVMMETDYH